MKYAVWLVRLWYAAWMIPAGLEHFIHIFPQPGYNTTRPLAHEMLFALLHSHLFDVVKAVELLTGIAVLFGFFTPLMLLVCMPVAFCVFWWDAPLSTWNYGSVMAGGRVLASDVLLCVAFVGCYRAMFPLRAKPQLPRHLANCDEPSHAAAGIGRAHHFRRLDVDERRQLLVLLGVVGANGP